MYIYKTMHRSYSNYVSIQSSLINSLQILFKLVSKKTRSSFENDLSILSSILFVNDAHSLHFGNLVYVLGDVTTEEAVSAYLVSPMDLSQYPKSIKLEELSGNNLLLYKTAKAFTDTTPPPFTLHPLLTFDDETFKALLAAFCIMRKGKNLILNEVKKDYFP